MISAVFTAECPGPKRRWLGFRIGGHAELEEAGRDIVCAAVSALSQAAIIGVTRVVGSEVEWRRSQGCLNIELDPATARREEVRVLLETVYLALEDVASQYPDRLSLRVLYSNERGR